MASSLSTGGVSGGTQAPSTDNLQAPVGSTGVAPSNATAVQPGTAADLLNGTQGLQLKNNALSTVDLGSRQASVSQFTPPAAKHTNPVLYGISGLFVVVAIALFVITMHSAKNTTEE